MSLLRSVVLISITIIFLMACGRADNQPDNWKTYGAGTGFKFQYPADAKLISNWREGTDKIDLPYKAGTNLLHKYLTVTVSEDSGGCDSPSSKIYPGEALEQEVTINEILFKKQTDSDIGAGNRRAWTGFSTMKNGSCVSLEFTLHSASMGALPDVTEFDEESEMQIFKKIVSTFRWTN